MDVLTSDIAQVKSIMLGLKPHRLQLTLFSRDLLIAEGAQWQYVCGQDSCRWRVKLNHATLLCTQNSTASREVFGSASVSSQTQRTGQPWQPPIKNGDSPKSIRHSGSIYIPDHDLLLTSHHQIWGTSMQWLQQQLCVRISVAISYTPGSPRHSTSLG